MQSLEFPLWLSGLWTHEAVGLILGLALWVEEPMLLQATG